MSQRWENISWRAGFLFWCVLCFLSACLPVCLSACLPVSVPVCLSACLPVCLSACLSVCLPVYLPDKFTPLLPDSFLPHVFSQPCQSGFKLKSLCALLSVSSSVHLSRSWRTGSVRCPSTWSSGSPCQPNLRKCIRVWVNSTGLKTALPRRAQISRQPRQLPLQNLPAWQTTAPSTCVSLL